MIVWIVLGVLVLLGLAIVISYNRFVSQRNLIRNSWANIDTELKRRYDLIPNLVETVKGYAGHERETLEAVVQARNAAVSATGTPAQQSAAEGPLVAALRQLLMLSERYPDLKANTGYLELQEELSNTEDRLQAARRFYNGNVEGYNRRTEAFPSNVVAGLFNFTPEQYFELDPVTREAAEQPPQVQF